MNNLKVLFLVSRKGVALLANDLIMLGTSIRSFRHLEHQNPSIISEDIGRASGVQQFRNGGGVGSESDRSRRHTVVLEDRIYCTAVFYINRVKITAPSIVIILSSKTTVCLRSDPIRSDSSVPPFRNCCTPLALPISSEIMDGF